MGRLELGRKIVQLGKKYRYAVIILIIGVVLMMIPNMSDQRESEEAQPTVPTQAKVELAQQIEEILSHVQGAGKVKVMLTVAEGQKTVYQTDSDASENGTRLETVVISGTDREELGLILQVNPAKYLGAIVVCQGADRTDVKLAITQAIARATGLGADQISVLKMK